MAEEEEEKEEKLRKSVLSIFQNLDFLKMVFKKSKIENREYLVVLGDNIKKFYKGEETEVNVDYVQEFRPEDIYAILHTHPRNNPIPSFQDLLATDYILYKYAFLSIHGVVTENLLTLYNHFTLDIDTLNHIYANNLVNSLNDEEKLKISGAIMINIDPLDIAKIPEIIDHFIGWMVYWSVILYDRYDFSFKALSMYDILKRHSLFVPKGRQIIEWYDGKKEGNIYWYIPEIDLTRGSALFYKVYEFIAENRVYRAVLESYGYTAEIDGIKAEKLISQCKTKKLCRVL